VLQISSIVVAVGIVVLASLLSPEGKQKKWVNFVLGVVAFSVLATPLLSVGDLSFSLPDTFPDQTTEGNAMDYLLSMSEIEIKKTLSDVFAIEQSHIHVDIDGDKKQLSVTFLCEVEETGVRRYLKKTVGEEWEVKINGR